MFPFPEQFVQRNVKSFIEDLADYPKKEHVLFITFSGYGKQEHRVIWQGKRG